MGRDVDEGDDSDDNDDGRIMTVMVIMMVMTTRMIHFHPIRLRNRVHDRCTRPLRHTMAGGLLIQYTSTMLMVSRPGVIEIDQCFRSMQSTVSYGLMVRRPRVIEMDQYFRRCRLGDVGSRSMRRHLRGAPNSSGCFAGLHKISTSRFKASITASLSSRLTFSMCSIVKQGSPMPDAAAHEEIDAKAVSLSSRYWSMEFKSQ